MLDPTGFRCRQHACVYGAKGKTGCRSCNAFTELLDRYGLERGAFGTKCGTHPQQDDKNCVACATHSAMREVNIRNDITIEQAPTVPSHQTLALRLSGDILLEEIEMSDGTRIERDLESQ